MPEQDFNSIFSKRLRHYLDENNMTQVELAKKLGVGTTSVYNWCNGIKTPRMDKIDALCDLFGCSRSDLIEDRSSTSTPIYYTNPETAKEAQEMFEDPEMRSLFHMKRNMDPDQFKIHIDYIKKLYKAEHPDYDEGC